MTGANAQVALPPQNDATARPMFNFNFWFLHF